MNIYKYNYSIPVVEPGLSSQNPIIGVPQDPVKIQAYRQLVGAILYLLGQAVKIQTESGSSIYVNKHRLYKLIQPALFMETYEDPIEKSLKLPAVINQLTLSLLIYPTPQQNFKQIAQDTFITRVNDRRLKIESLENLKTELAKFIELLKNPVQPSLADRNRRVNRLKASMDDNLEYSTKLHPFNIALYAPLFDVSDLTKFIPLLEELASRVEESKIDKQKSYQDSLQNMSYRLEDLARYPKAIESIELSSLVSLIKLEEQFLDLSTPILNVYKSDDFLIRLQSFKNDLFAKFQPTDQVDQILEQLKIADNLVNLSHHASENLENSKHAKTYMKKTDHYKTFSKEIVDHIKILAQRLSTSEIEQALNADFNIEGFYKRAGNALKEELKRPRIKQA